MFVCLSDRERGEREKLNRVGLPLFTFDLHALPHFHRILVQVANLI